MVLRPTRRVACLDLPLEGAGLVVWFAGRLTVPSRPGELHPLGQLLITAVFQNFSGLEIDLHRCNGLQWKWLRTAINGNLGPDYLHLSIPSGRDSVQLS